MVMDNAGKTLTIKHIPGPLGVRGRYSDNRLIEAKLGWKPSMTLQEGLEMTYPWIREQVKKAADQRRPDLADSLRMVSLWRVPHGRMATAAHF